MNNYWDRRHGEILAAFLSELTHEKIRWFIIRGYEGLPNNNPSKDVDVMIDVGKEKKAAKLLKKCCKKAGITHFHHDVFGHIHCYIGMNIDTKVSIHIDLVEGYISKGYEIYSFDELYKHTIDYNGMRVLDDLMNGVMLIVYKIFGYKTVKLKKQYIEDIKKSYFENRIEFTNEICKITSRKFGLWICDRIEHQDFDSIIAKSDLLTRLLKNYTWKKRPVSTFLYILEFLSQKVLRIIFAYRIHEKSFAVLAPDGTGKTTFLDNLIEQLNYFYVNNPQDGRFHVYHFRPNVFPNLGVMGEKAGMMKQDTDFTNPHRAKPAGVFSSLLRLSYYTLDYIIGWAKCVRNDVHYDRYSVFDRYSYDFIVDPSRSRIGLSYSIRKLFVALTPKPKIVFYLKAEPNTIHDRKAELPLDEIKRQIGEYDKLAFTNQKKFIIIDAEESPEKMVQEALRIILDKYTDHL